MNFQLLVQCEWMNLQLLIPRVDEPLATLSSLLRRGHMEKFPVLGGSWFIIIITIKNLRFWFFKEHQNSSGFLRKHNVGFGSHPVLEKLIVQFRFQFLEIRLSDTRFQVTRSVINCLLTPGSRLFFSPKKSLILKNLHSEGCQFQNWVRV